MAKRTTFTLNASSQVKSDRLAEFLNASIEEDLTTVPGIGAKGAEILREAGITTTHALIGKFLMLRTPGITVREHCDAFYEYLSEIGINAFRAGIVKAVAEKVNTWIPGIFDESVFTE